jgi:hypothetical protein
MASSSNAPDADSQHDPVIFIPPVLFFPLVPLKQRMLCREVSATWNKALADPMLWVDLDFSSAPCTPRLLRAASALAQGRLRSLDLSAWSTDLLAKLLLVASQNSTTLTRLSITGLHAPAMLSCVQIEALIRAAPSLKRLECDAARLELDEAAVALLGKTGIFSSVQLREVRLESPRSDDAAAEELSAAVAKHESITSVTLEQLRSPRSVCAGLEAAASASQLCSLKLHFCMLDSSCLAPLRAALAGSLTELAISAQTQSPFAGPQLAGFCAALRAYHE